MENQGKITIESGNHKAIFNIVNLENGEQKVTINFEPELDKNDNSNEVNFVRNMTQILISILRGEV